VKGASPEWALFLDFDGTLVEIADRPDAVVVDPALPALLERLRQRFGGAAAIVTGRSVPVIEGFLPDLSLDICGLHGMERRIGAQISHLAAENLPAFRQAVDMLVARLSPQNVLIEDKGESIALHWRLNPQAEPEIRAAAQAAMAMLAPAFRLQNGKALVEIVPAVSGKGGAVETLMREAPYRGRRPLFVGDDVTDENGFAAVNALGGATLKVGPGQTLAEKRIATPALFRAWLSELADGRADYDDLDRS
jgi:trehalose 6-phosphate phosphatase